MYSGTFVPESLIFSRPVTGAIVGIHDPNLIAQPIENVSHKRLAGAYFQDATLRRSGRENRLKHPRSLAVLEVSICRCEWMEMIEAIAKIAHCCIAQRLRFEAVVAIGSGNSGQLMVAKPDVRLVWKPVFRWFAHHIFLVWQ